VTCPGGRLGLTSWLSEEDDDSFEEWMGGTVGLINGVRRYQRLEGRQFGLAKHSLGVCRCSVLLSAIAALQRHSRALAQASVV
jgi:hypothetical protein